MFNKVLVAMSGGVDSSVAALLLRRQGYDVIGVSMNLFSCRDAPSRNCCSPADRQDARTVCEKLGIKHYVVDYREQFRKAVVGPFIEEYANGRTPSPCILCNQHLKFGALFGEAARLGADYIATGHYAQVMHDGSVYRLLCAADTSKDQSYFLFTLTQNELRRILFPVGGLSKDEVRAIAKDGGLLVYEKPESQEVCFVPHDDYIAFIESQVGLRLKGPGEFVGMNGNKVGRHRGIHAYTIGQRRGLGFGVGSRQYVVRIDADRNEVVLGSNNDLMRCDMIVRGVSWVYDGAAAAAKATVKIRSAHAGEDADLKRLGGHAVRVHFKRPVRAITPGQAAVFYNGDEVLGGGSIE